MAQVQVSAWASTGFPTGPQALENRWEWTLVAAVSLLAAEGTELRDASINSLTVKFSTRRLSRNPNSQTVAREFCFALWLNCQGLRTERNDRVVTQGRAKVASGLMSPNLREGRWVECSLNTKVPETLIVEGNEAGVRGSGWFLSWQAGSRRWSLLSCCGWTLGVRACSVVSDSFATLWTVARHGILCPWDFVGKDTGMGCHSLLQGIFQTQGLNQRRLHCRQILYLLSHWGSPWTLWGGNKFKGAQSTTRSWVSTCRESWSQILPTL